MYVTIEPIFFFYAIQEGLKNSFTELKKNLAWVERLDLTNYPAVDIAAKAENGSEQNEGNEEINVEDDFQREMYL